ncbi:MAG TPA: SDR family NAD(P)-dependent oxidoreductase, partial [Trueperaceae bacterium]|nr:SDR family NAD(P)-dependent oxidoreductase [Trueperaceae bacterium]
MTQRATDNRRLARHIAIVTGAESGLGQAIAIEFAKEGADVCVTFYSDEAGAAETKAAVEEAGGRAIVRQVDVREL